jgi:hypothetical protein
MKRIFIIEIMSGEGEANDGFTVNFHDATAEAALFVEGKFECGRDAECVELAAGGAEEGFGVSEFLDSDAARVERASREKRAGTGDAEADGVSGDVEAFASKGKHVAVVIGGEAKA